MKFEEEWEPDNELESTLHASKDCLQSPLLCFSRINNESDLDSEDNVDFQAVINEKSPTNCPFSDYEAVELEEGEAKPSREKG